MWRSQSVHNQAETEFLDQAIERIERDEHLNSHARAILTGAGAQEPLIALSLLTPQDVRFHAEGPFMREHLKLMLAVLFAMVEEKFHLIDVEEFRRLKGYEGEVDELEETFKEHASFFEAFTLFHDATKWLTATFTSLPGSRGEELGFVSVRSHHFDEFAHERARERGKYLDLYHAFEGTITGVSPRDVQARFYSTYGIQVHYPHHGRKIHAPVYQDLLDRVCFAHGLSSRDRDLLDDLTTHHMEFAVDFRSVRPIAIRRYTHLATKRGYDADDFLDLLQGCLFLDGVCGSKRLTDGNYWHDATPLVNCLRSEHNFAPWRRLEKEEEREQNEKFRRRKVFQEVGLDGGSLMDLLEMESGPDFGNALRDIQAAVIGEGEMPKFGGRIDLEISERAGKFYERMFQKGE
jgi:hypothetical protein